MNKSDTPTKQKISIPLRLSPEIYEQMMDVVQKKKKKERGYSVNQYLTEIVAAVGGLLLIYLGLVTDRIGVSLVAVAAVIRCIKRTRAKAVAAS